MSRLAILIAFLTLFFTNIGQVAAVETLVFDSTNAYLGTCQLTDKSEWTLKEDFNVTKFQIWYSWNQGETSLPVKVFFEGNTFAEFEAVRGGCDPYQKQWCNADYQINKLFAKGKYSTEIPTARQCLKPGGTGAVRLYTDVQTTPTPAPVSTPVPTPTPTPVAVVPTVKQEVKTGECACNQNLIILTAVGSSAITSFLTVLLLKKFKV